MQPYLYISLAKSSTAMAKQYCVIEFHIITNNETDAYISTSASVIRLFYHPVFTCDINNESSQEDIGHFIEQLISHLIIPYDILLYATAITLSVDVCRYDLSDEPTVDKNITLNTRSSVFYA